MKHLKKQLLKNEAKYFGVIFGVLLAIVLLIALFFTQVPHNFQSLDLKTVLLGAGLFGGGYLFSRLVNRFSTRFQSTTTNLICKILKVKQVVVGENKIEEVLNEHFGGSSVILRDVQTHYGDIDFLIFGPKGVLVLEVKNLNENIIVDEETLWREQDNGDTRKREHNSPFVQMKKAQDFVSKKLTAASLSPKYVTGMVVFVGAPVNIIRRPKDIWVVNGVRALKSGLSQLNDRSAIFTPEYSQKLSRVFG